MNDDRLQDHAREIGVVLARRGVDNPWIDHVWSPHAVLVPAPATAPGMKLSQEGSVELFYAGPATIELHPSETANYRDNLESGGPKLWIAARTKADGVAPDFIRATADPTEGEALFESGAEIVGTLALPAELAGWIAGFIETFHVERVFVKRQRDRSERKARGFSPRGEGGHER
jgi:hypothetical protein